MTIHIQSDRAASGPLGLVWDGPGAVASCDDHRIAREILRQPGFSEVVPAPQGRHEAPEPVEPAAAEDDADESDPAKPRRTRKTAVTE